MLERDFTYIDDIVDAIVSLIDETPSREESLGSDMNAASTSAVPYKVFNTVNNKPEKLMDFIRTLEVAIGKEAKKEY